MTLSSWLLALRARCGKLSGLAPGRRALSKRADRRGPVEWRADALETRVLPTVSVLFYNATLEITCDAADSVTVQSNAGGDVEVLDQNGLITLSPDVPAASVTSIIVTGSDSPNVIDLQGVTPGAFTGLTSIAVTMGDGADDYRGSHQFGDSVFGGDGNDTIFGEGGNDTLNGGDGGDRIDGHTGDDSILGGDGSDTIVGQQGLDTIDGGNHDDSIDGGSENDSILAGDGEDSVDGGDGDDFVNGESGADTLTGNAGNDSILGGGENDSLFGSDGNDTLSGQAGNDTVSGETGNDSLLGDGGLDSLLGGAGQDVLNGGADADTLVGGSDNDSLLGGAGNDSLAGDELTPQANSVGNDVLNGQAGNDTLEGGGGNDSLDGGAGNDLLQPNVVDLTTGALLLSIDDTSVVEGNAGFTNLVVTVRLSQTTTETVTVDFATQDDTAVAGVDYVAVNGTLVFASGQTTRTITIPVLSDLRDESDERISVVLANPTGGTITDSQGVVTITDDDVSANATPSISIADVEVIPERDAPVIIFLLDVSGSVEDPYSGAIVDDVNGDNLANTVLDAELDALIQLNNQFATQYGGSALVAIETTRNANGRRIEMDPRLSTLTTFSSTLAIAPNADIDNNSSPDVADVLRKVRVQTGGVGQTGLLEAAIQTFQTFGVNATDGRGGLLVFLSDGFINDANQADLDTLQQMGVTIRAFAVGAVNAVDLGTMQTFDPTATALTDSSQLQQQISTIDPPTTSVAVNVTLSQPSGNTITVNYSTANGTAIAGPDYEAGANTIMFSPGTTTQTITLEIERDDGNEPDENFFVNLSGAVNAAIGDSQGQVIIVDDDGAVISAPTLAISDLTLAEGNSGTTNFDFTVTLTRPTGNNSAVTVQFTTQDDSAISSGATPDFAARSGTLTFAAGVTTQQIRVPVNGDGGGSLAGDPTESFFVHLLNPVGAILTDSRAVGLILDDDSASPTSLVLVNDVLIDESNGVTVVTLRLSSPALAPVSINLTTADGTARAGSDYSAATTTINIPIGGTSGTASISITGDLRDEIAEFFIVNLSAPLNALLTATSLQVTIRDDDGSSFSSPNDVLLVGGDGNDTLNAGLGNDTLNGGAGVDSLSGGAGTDSILGGMEADTLNGGNGDDTLDGQGGNDSVESGAGDDLFVWNSAGDGNDTMSNTSGFDTVAVNGSAATDVYSVGKSATGLLTVTNVGSTFLVPKTIGRVIINGLAGNDTITVGALNGVLQTALTINGGDGNDTLSAAGMTTGTVRMRLNGDAGNDSLTGSASLDTLDGGDGDDTALGGLGNDVMLGGAGIDRFNGEAGDDLILGGSGNDVLQGFAGNDSILGELGDDTVTAGDGNDTVSGGTGRDSLTGEAGNDSLLGNEFSDTIRGGDGNDTIDGGTEADSIAGDLGNDLIRGNHGNDTIDGGDGDDSVIGGDGSDSILGGNGHDAVNGGDGADTVNGGAGRDSILGGNGNDILLGGADADILLGGDGDDTLNGQGSTDTLAGNEGTDVNNDTTFVINEAFTLPALLLSVLV